MPQKAIYAVAVLKKRVQEEFIGPYVMLTKQLTFYILTLLVLSLGQMTVSYFLVGVLRLPGLPLLIDARPLTSRNSVEVCNTLSQTVAFFKALKCEGVTIGETSRVKRLHSDRAGELLLR